MADALDALEVSVETEENILLAVSKFTARPADLVVLGLAHLDDRDLRGVISVFRKLRPGVYILLAFPPRRRDSAVKALTFGADSYILEPFYLGEFSELVRRGLIRARVVPTDTPPSDAEGLEKLAAAVAHAVNNPLQILEFLLSDEAESTPDADEIRHETARVAAVVEELLAFAHRDEVRTVEVDLNRVVSDAVPTRGGKRLIRRKLADDPPSVEGDPAKLTLAFRALAGLARARGTLERLEVVTGRSETDAATVTYRARDLVLTPDERRELFRPFGGPVQGELGLLAAAAEGILRAHGAKIETASTEADGTTVTIRFPKAGALARREPEEGARTKGE
jgi:signal transduction histidine kinase